MTIDIKDSSQYTNRAAYVPIEIAQINRNHEKKDNCQFDRYKKIYRKQQNNKKINKKIKKIYFPILFNLQIICFYNYNYIYFKNIINIYL